MMIGGGTLTSSPSSKIILEDFPAGIFRCGTEIFRSVPRKTFHHLKFLRLDSAQSRILKPIPLRSSSIKNSQVHAEAEEIEALEKSTKTVRVRFQLRKECVFGEHFFILGDDSVFGGLWDPGNALPLNWSDGHVWTVDLDLPVGRLVEFKFILKATTGEVLWQPGPNRALETWETNKTIRICEDWENADLQMIIEEDFVPLNQEDITHPQQSMSVNTNVSSKYAEVVLTVQQNSSVVVVENAGYVSDESAENSSSEKTMEPLNEALTALEVTKEAMFTEEESPVLVPGLFSLSDLENEEVEVINEGKAETLPEVDKKQQPKRERNEKGKVKAISLFEKSEREAVKGGEQRHYNAAEEEMQQRVETETLGTPDVLLEKDIQWGRRKLYKLLSNFGLF
ncbi:Phosphoglucan, water dikinase [Cardamine amara subsp. amara]|uniref:Phosphoglucan, water dikinase n=1 Tax=Cardamine amara subsp. amara TaxID=228776 RepID=A0ABD0ZHA2_CARAN